MQSGEPWPAASTPMPGLLAVSPAAKEELAGVSTGGAANLSPGTPETDRRPVRSDVSEENLGDFSRGPIRSEARLDFPSGPRRIGALLGIPIVHPRRSLDLSPFRG